jgi:hypothetical protein
MCPEPPPLAVQRQKGILDDFLCSAPFTEEAERQSDQIRAVPPKQRIYRVITIRVGIDGRRRHDIRPSDVTSHDHLRHHDKLRLAVSRSAASDNDTQSALISYPSSSIVVGKPCCWAYGPACGRPAR